MEKNFAIRADGENAHDFIFVVRNHVEQRIALGADAERACGVDTDASIDVPRRRLDRCADGSCLHDLGQCARIYDISCCSYNRIQFSFMICS